MAYNLDNFLGRLVLPTGIRHWLLTAPLEKPFTIGVKIVHHVSHGGSGSPAR